MKQRFFLFLSAVVVSAVVPLASAIEESSAEAWKGPNPQAEALLVIKKRMTPHHRASLFTALKGRENTAGPVICAGEVVAITEDGVLYSINTGTLKTRSVEFGRQVYTTPLCINGKEVVIGDEDGWLYVVDVSSFEVSEKRRVATYPVRKLWKKEDRIFVKDASGKLMILKLSAGGTSKKILGNTLFTFDLSSKGYLKDYVIIRDAPIRACGAYAGTVVDGRAKIVNFLSGTNIMQQHKTPPIDDVICFEDKSSKDRPAWAGLDAGGGIIYQIKLASSNKDKSEQEIEMGREVYQFERKEKIVYPFFLKCHEDGNGNTGAARTTGVAPVLIITNQRILLLTPGKLEGEWRRENSKSRFLPTIRTLGVFRRELPEGTGFSGMNCVVRKISDNKGVNYYVAGVAGKSLFVMGPAAAGEKIDYVVEPLPYTALAPPRVFIPPFASSFFMVALLDSGDELTLFEVLSEDALHNLPHDVMR